MGLLAMTPTAFLCSLSARVDEHMQQFAYEEEPKKRNPLLRAGMAGGAAVGGVVAGDALSKRLPGIKAGAEAYKVRAKQGAKDAAFKGSRKVASGMNTAGNKLIGRKTRFDKLSKLSNSDAHFRKQGIKKTAKSLGDIPFVDTGAKVGQRLKKGAKFLRKKSMRFFDQGHEFAGGYVNTKEGVVKERGAGPHFSRNAGKYIGTAVATPLVGLPVGALIDRGRRKDNVDDTSREQNAPWKKKKGAKVVRNVRAEKESAAAKKKARLGSAGYGPGGKKAAAAAAAKKDLGALAVSLVELEVKLQSL